MSDQDDSISGTVTHLVVLSLLHRGRIGLTECNEKDPYFQFVGRFRGVRQFRQTRERFVEVADRLVPRSFLSEMKRLSRYPRPRPLGPSLSAVYESVLPGPTPFAGIGDRA